MQDKHVQSLRYKLQKRVRRVNSADSAHFHIRLKHLFLFVDSMPLLCGVRDELLARTRAMNVDDMVSRIIKEETLSGENEEEAAAIGYLLLKQYVTNPEAVDLFNIAHRWGQRGGNDGSIEFAREAFLEPFYEYIDEHIDDQQAILYFLRRYKHHCEWFSSVQLRQAVQSDTQKGERSLAFNMYEYLHGQGIDFHIEPRSASGIADFVADQVGDDRVVADAKVFWPEKSKGKAYLVSAFHQVYTYARDYNEPCAYLVVFKMCKEDVNFLLPASDTMFPCLSLNNKTVFFVVVDICDHEVPASKRGPLKSVDISDKDLIQSVELNEDADPAMAPEC